MIIGGVIVNAINAKKIILILLYLPKENTERFIIGRTRITKTLFLFEKEIKSKLGIEIDEDSLPEFFAYDYGPYSADLFDNLNFFRQAGFINFENEDDAENTKYKLTDKGINWVEKNLLNEIDTVSLELLTKFKKKMSELSLNDILNYVYNKYPKYAKKSKIKDRYLD